MFHQWLVTSSESLGFPGRYGHGPQRLRDSSRAAPTYLLHGTNDRVTTVVPSQRLCGRNVVPGDSDRAGLSRVTVV